MRTRTLIVLLTAACAAITIGAIAACAAADPGDWTERH